MIFKILMIFTLFNILIPATAWAESISDGKFENISIDDGLSNEYITTIFQDSKGYMWLGTEDGLNRYDGEIIKIYNCNIEDENTLSSTYIIDIEEDCHGNIWIGTDDGLDILNTDTDTITRVKDLDNKYNLGNLRITSLLRSSYEENIMWVGTENGLMKIDLKDKTIRVFYHDENNPDSLSSSSITCLEEDENNGLWVGTNRGVNIIDKNLGINNKIDEYKSFICYISKDATGKIWVSTKGGIFMFNPEGDETDSIYEINSEGVKKYSRKYKSIENIYNNNSNEIKLYDNLIFNDSQNNIWLSSCNGAIRYSKDKNDFNIFKKNINSKNSISSNIITSFYEDSNGTIWIGTDKGVNILNENILFNCISKEEAENIVSIVEHNDYVWLASKFGGIYIYNKEDWHLEKRLYDEENFTLNDRYIKSLFKINERYILMVTNRDLVYFDVINHSYKEMLIGDDYFSELNYIYSDKEDIWIATTTDFYSYNINNAQKTYYSESMKELGINPARIKYILQDNEDEDIIWLGGVGVGLIKYHKKQGVMERYLNDPLDKKSLIYNYINCMAFDNEGDLWIGTNVGLSKFDVKTKKFNSYTMADGLTNNFINSILIDNNGDVWISTNKGLNKFDIRDNSFIKYTKMDGLYGYQFNLNSSLKLDDGTIIFGSTKGCTYFNSDRLLDYKMCKDQVVIGDIYVGKNKVVYDGNELVLEYNYKDLYINYFLPNYENLNNITYEYILEGIDKNWRYVDARSCLEFKWLEPGKYTLKVRARDEHGEQTKETMINIRVKNPIWKTPLAYIIYIAIISVFIIYVFNYVRILQHLVNQKTKKLNKQLEENKRLSEEIINNEKFKNNYFVNLSHELRTPINVINSTSQLINSLSANKSIPYEKLNRYMDIISKSCNNLLKIINDIIDSSKIETGKYKIHKENNDIVYIVEEAALNMSKYIEEKGLNLIIDPDMEEKIISCDAIEIERCIINLLGNAVKFTEEGGQISVYIKGVEGNVEISIEDTGVGISKEDQEFIFKRFEQVEGTKVTKVSSSGIGLTLVKYIIELHGGYVTLESELNKGSRFTIVLPDIVEEV